MNSTLEEIEAAVCARFNLSLEDLRGPDRKRGTARPRQIAMFLAREMTPLSSPEIGRHFNRTHGAVLRGQIHIRDLMEQFPYLAAHVQGCREIVSKMSNMKQSTHKRAA